MNASQVLNLAVLIKQIAELHERSFDHDASNRAIAECIIDRTKMVDHNEFYKISIRDAVKQICPAYLQEMVTLLMVHHWNESTNWADRFISAWTSGSDVAVSLINDHMNQLFKD
jgi:hypothetical protein